MKISQKGIDLIKKYEGVVLHAYRDPIGKWTIGYGHTVGVKKGQTLTQKEAEDLLKKDLKIYERHVENTKLSLNQNQYDSLVSFTYNCGVGNLQMLVRGRTLTEIGNAIILYNKAGGRVLNGLVRRRKEEQKIFFTKDTSKPRLLKLTKKMMRGQDVDDLQRRLIQMYYFPDIAKNNRGRDSIFRKNTDNAFRRWQSVYTPQMVDGKYGDNSRRILESQTK